MAAPRRARIVDSTDPNVVDLVAATLRAGGLVAFPTDTVYGVAASIDRPDAVSALYQVKGRPLDRPIPVLVSDRSQVARLTAEVDPAIEQVLARFWPGPLTVALPAASWIPHEIVRDSGRVGLRMPDHPLALAIIAAAGGALATTSANRSGEPAAQTVAEAAAALGDRVELLVDGGRTESGVPSTVIVVDGRRISVARRGALDPAEIVQAVPGLCLIDG